MPKTRKYKIAEGRALVLPQGLLPGPGATNMRLGPGDVFELDSEDARTVRHGRFVALLLKDGDIVEVGAETPSSTPTAAPTAPTAPVAINPPLGGK